MHVKIQRTRGMIAAGTGDVEIEKISSAGDMTIAARFTVSQAAEQYAHVVRFTAYTKLLARSAVTDHIRSGYVAHDELMGAIKLSMSSAKAWAKAQAGLAVASCSENITGVFASARLPGKIIEFVEPDVAARRGDNVGFHHAVQQLTSPETSRESLIDAVTLHGVDPGVMGHGLHRGSDHSRTISGLTTPHVSKNVSSVIAGHVSALVASNDVTHSNMSVPTVFPKDVTARASGSIRITVPADRMMSERAKLDKLVLVLQLIDENGIAVDSVTLGFDVATQTAAFMTPKTAPSVSLSVGKSTATLSIKAGDHAAERMRVVARTILRAGQLLPGYNVVTDVPVLSHLHEMKVSVPVPTSSTVIYRVFPVGPGGHVCARFGGVVLRPSRPAVPTHTSLTTIATADGLMIEVREPPTRVRSVEIFRRDLTLHDSRVTPVGLPIRISGDEYAPDHVSVVDRDLKPDHVYEHSCRITHTDGKVVFTGTVHTTYTPFTAGKVVTELSELAVDRASGVPDVTFSIKSSIADTHMDIVRHVLVAQGVDDKYASEIVAERDKLKQLLVHMVTRVDLTTGLRDDMGLVTDEVFRDSEHRALGAPPVEEGRRYRYEVTAALRSPETLFQTLVKPVVDVATRKTYNVLPSKHFHPLALARGTIVTPKSLLTKHARSEFGHGSVGNVVTVDVMLDRPIARLVDVVSTPSGVNTVKIGWHTTGDQSTIDHFIIVQMIAGVRTVIGTCHAEFPHGTYEFFHTIAPDDHGPRSYIVMIMAYDFSLGDMQETEEIVP